MVRGFDRRFYFVMLVALVVVGLVYGSGSDVVGHSGEELGLSGDVIVTDGFCRKVTGVGCGELSGVVLEKAILDGDGGLFSVMGHSGDDLMLNVDTSVDDGFCRKVTGVGCGAVRGCGEVDDVVNSYSGTVSEYAWEYYEISFESGVVEMTIDLFDLTDDVDLYVRKGSLPTRSIGDYDCKSAGSGKRSESCDISFDAPMIVYIGIYGYDGGDYNLKATSSISLSGNADDVVFDNKVGHGGGEISLTGGSVVSNEFCRKVTGVGCGEVRCFVGCGDYSHGEVVGTGVDQVDEGMTSYSYSQENTRATKPYGVTYFERPYKKACKDGVIKKEYIENWKVDHCMLSGRGSYHEPNTCSGTNIAPGVYGRFGICASHGYGFIWGTCELEDTAPKDTSTAVEIPD
jgi:hypothetical protein